MKKKHIIKIGYQYFATDSPTAASQLIGLLAKMQKVRWQSESRGFVWEPDPDKLEISLELNQKYHDPEERKPEKPKKALALPAPKRGSILCICEKSYVAPKQQCPHCGRAFSESHNRTHGSTAINSQLNLED